MASVSLTVSLYDPDIEGEDGEGRTLNDILAFSDSELEYHHDFIQYLFPLPERSPVNPHAPVINKATRDAFLQRPELRKSMFRSLTRMAQFYGFEVKVSSRQEGDGKVEIFMRPNAQKWDRNSRLWRTRFSHNHLRITRIIRCLRVLGMERLAHGFHQTLLANDTSGAISARTRMYWDRAATRGLHLAPEEEDDEARGVSWLREDADADGGGANGEGGESGFDAQSGRMAVLAREEVGEV